jgi:hypothetical protein
VEDQNKKRPRRREWRGLFAVTELQVQAFARLALRRVTRAAAAAPNSNTIGGAGTLTPLLELVEEEVELALEVLDELAELVDVLVPPPKLDEDVLVEAVKIALPVLPPKKAPLKKPPPKPLLPPLDGTTTIPLLPPPLTTGGSGGRGGA